MSGFRHVAQDAEHAVILLCEDSHWTRSHSPSSIERMFDLMLEEPPWLADTPSDWRPGFLEHTDIPPPGYSPANVQPSGWLALEVDAATGEGGAGLDDAELVDAVVALDHLTSWAQARQARLLAEFSRRRPGDDPQAMNCDRPSSISRYAPDEIGLALHLARGTAMVRLGQATHLATTLPDTLCVGERPARPAQSPRHQRRHRLREP